MQYMLMIHDDGAAMQKATKPEMDSFMAAYEAYTKAMVEAGVPAGWRAVAAVPHGNHDPRAEWQGAGD